MKPDLTIDALLREAEAFAAIENASDEPTLYGVTDGKAVGTYLEHKFTGYLANSYTFLRGNSASGIDIPGLDLDIKVTSVRQPQSSCPFRSARQKIYGLGYHLLIFVYEKQDDALSLTSRLNIQHAIFVEKEYTADYQMTRSILQLLANNANADDLVALMMDRNLPVDEIESLNLAEEILKNPPLQGYVTISNALQWRLQYTRVIANAGIVGGIHRIR